MTFTDPLLLAFIPVFIALFIYMRMKRRDGAFIFPSRKTIKYSGNPIKIGLARKLPYLRAAGFVFILFAIAGPELKVEERVRKAGIGVVMAIDCSSSMLVDDLRIDLETLAREDLPRGTRSLTRLDGVKMVARDFVSGRPDNLVGVVAFSAEAFLICPLTFHHEWVYDAIDRIQVGLIKDGTAIGSAIMSSLSTLRDLEAETRIIVLLTDGINNFGTIPPLVAAEVARTLGIKIYTVGLVGGSGGFLETDDGSGRRIFTRPAIEVDEDELRAIAAITGGQYFRAEDLRSLRESYKEIDRLERSKIERGEYHDNISVFHYFVYAALLCIVTESLLSRTILRKIP